MTQLGLLKLFWKSCCDRYCDRYFSLPYRQLAWHMNQVEEKAFCVAAKHFELQVPISVRPREVTRLALPHIGLAPHAI